MEDDVKGYKTSKDYGKLYEYIKSGIRVLGWVYNDRVKMFDCVEIKYFPEDKGHFIGTRGIAYSNYDKTLAGFKKNCEYFDVEYIIPNNGG